VLLMAHWSCIHMRDVICSAIEPFEDRQNPKFVVTAGNFELTGDEILPLTLSLNELCTNAVKYGALSAAGGRIAIAAHADHASKRFKLTWSEIGGPLVHEPARRGFGSRLINLLAGQLHGSARVRFAPAGVVYELDAPLLS